MPGPVPKRSDQRRRENKPEVPITEGVHLEAVVPETPDGWHEVAKRVFDGLKASGQSFYYQQSDWSVAYLICESLSLDLQPQFVGFRSTGRDTSEPEFAVIPLKGASLSAYLKALTSLMATEGDRRRLRMELSRPAQGVEGPDEVEDELDAFRSRRAGQSSGDSARGSA